MKTKKSKLAWTTDGRSHELNSKGLVRVVVHHYVGYPPDQWLLTCHPFAIRRELRSKDVEEAKAEAITIMQDMFKKAVAFLEGK